MPIFEYKCEKCGSSTEFLEKNASKKKHKCPKCGSGEMVKLFSSFAVGGQHDGTSSNCGSCTDMGCPHSRG